jgi:cytosine/uracil/thiamine/allantoin permease
MMEDYISQMEWENTHPPDRRGRPSVKYQPHWKYKRVYPHTKQMPVYMWIILVLFFGISFGIFIFFESRKNPGETIFAIFIVLWLIGMIYYLSRKPK